jgi:DNA-binding transcriptional LysR family regulator
MNPDSLGAAELALVLVLTRTATLADAAQRLGVDVSTVFRSLQRLEKRLGRRLFERDRRGVHAGELALRLAEHAERIEGELEAARSHLAAREDRVSGRVRISTTDTLLYGLVMPVLDDLIDRHPELNLELDARYDLASLTRREADIALRATNQPPGHLVGRSLGPVRVAIHGHRRLARGALSLAEFAALPWAAPDPALPDHPSVRWRRRHLPKVTPRLELHSIVAVMQAISAGLAIGIVPLFLAQAHAEVEALSAPLDEAQTELWMLAHPESRHLRRIAVVAAELAAKVRLR